MRKPTSALALASVFLALLLAAATSAYGQHLSIKTTLSTSSGGQNPANIYCDDQVTITTEVQNNFVFGISPARFRQTFPVGCTVQNVQVISLITGVQPSTTVTPNLNVVDYDVGNGFLTPPSDKVTFDLIIPCSVISTPITHTVLPTSPVTVIDFLTDHANPFQFIASSMIILPIPPNSPVLTLVDADQQRQFEIAATAPAGRIGGFTLTYTPESEIRFNSFTFVALPFSGVAGPPLQLLLSDLRTPNLLGAYTITIPKAAVAALFPNNPGGFMFFNDRIQVTESYDVLRCSPTPANDDTVINLTWFCHDSDGAGHAVPHGPCNTIPIPFRETLLVEKSEGGITPSFAINPLHSPPQAGDGDPLVFCYPLPAGTHPSDIVVKLSNSAADVSVTLPGPPPLGGNKLAGSAVKTMHSVRFSMRQEDFAESILINANDPSKSFPHTQIYVQGSIAGVPTPPVLVDTIKGFYAYDPTTHKVTLNFDALSAAFQTAQGQPTTAPYQPLGAAGPLVNRFVPEGTPPTGAVYPRDTVNPNKLVADNDVYNELVEQGEISLIFKQASFLCQYPLDFYPVTPGSGAFPNGFGFEDAKPSVGYLFFGQNGSDRVEVNYDDMSQQFGPSIRAESLKWVGGTATFRSLTPHGLVVNQAVDITGAPQPGYNGTFIVTGNLNLNEFTYQITSNPGNNAISAASLSIAGSTATFTTAIPSGFVPGDSVIISGATHPQYNGLQIVETVQTLGGNSFTYSLTMLPPGNDPSLSIEAMPASVMAAGSHNPHLATMHDYGNLHNNFPVIIDSLASSLPNPPGGQDMLINQSALVQFQYAYAGGEPNPSPFTFKGTATPSLYFNCQPSYIARLQIPASYQLNSATYYPGPNLTDQAGPVPLFDTAAPVLPIPNPIPYIDPATQIPYYIYTFVGPATGPTLGYDGHIDANVTLTNCPYGDFGFDTFTTKVQAICSGCADDACASTIAVIRAQLYRHCQGDCDGDPAPQSTTSLDYKRHTFGTVSATDNTPINVNTPNITLRRVYSCDQVEFIATGSFSPAAGNKLGFRLQNVFAPNAASIIPFQFFEFEQGYLTYTPANGSPLTYNINASTDVGTTFMGTGGWPYVGPNANSPADLFVTFADPADTVFASALVGSVTLALEVHIFVKIKPMDFVFTAGTYPLQITGEFWGLPTGLPAKGSCDPWHRTMNVLGVSATAQAIISPSHEEGVCSRNFLLRTIVTGGLGTFDEFENEYRPWVQWPNPITMALPLGVSLDSATFTVVNRPDFLYGLGEYDLLAHPVDLSQTAATTTTGPTISFKTYDNGTAWPVLDRAGLPMDLRIQGTLLNDCPILVDTPVPLGWPYISQVCSTDLDCRKTNPLGSLNYLAVSPIPDVSLSTGVYQYHIFSSLTTINTAPLPPAIKFQYLGWPNSHIENAWIKIDSGNMMTVNTVVLNNNLPIHVGPGGYFRIGDITAGTTSPAYINLGNGQPIASGTGGVKINNCTPGDPFPVTIYYGYFCGGYPVGAADPTPCFTSSYTFEVYPEPSGLAMQVTPPTQTTAQTPIGSPCDSYVYKVRMSSTMTADVENPKLAVTMPAGMSVVSATYLTSGGASGSLTIPSLSANVYLFDVNGAYANNGIPPFPGYVDVFVTVTGGCAASPTIGFQATGENICSSALPAQNASYMLGLTPQTLQLTVPTTGLNLGCNPTTFPDDNDVKLLCGVSGGCNPTINVTHTPDSIIGCAGTRDFTVVAGGPSCPNAITLHVVYHWTVNLTGPQFVNCPTTPIPLPCNSAPTCQTTVAGTIAAHMIAANDLCSGASHTALCTPGQVMVTGGQASQIFTLTATNDCGIPSTCLLTYTWPVDCETNCCDSCMENAYVSYTVPVLASPAVNFLVNHLCRGQNLLNEVLSSVPPNTTVNKWNTTGQTYDPVDTYHNASGWLNGNNNPSLTTLNPGEGFVLQSPVAFNLTFYGCDPTNCSLPCLPATNGWALAGRQGIGTAKWTDLSSCPPICGTQLRIWDGTNFRLYDYFDDVWHDGNGAIIAEPVLPLGQSAFVNLVESTNCCCSGCVTNDYVYITNTIAVGVNFLANNLCQGTNDSVNTILTNLPSFTQLLLWNYATQSYDPPLTYLDEFDALPGPAGWYDQNGNLSAATLSPGNGYVLQNSSGAPFDLIQQGCPSTCPPPCLPLTNGCRLVGGLGLEPARWTNLSSCPPICGTQVRIWNGTIFDSFEFMNGFWVPQEPVLGVGQSAFVCFAANTNCCTNAQSFVINGSFEITSPAVGPGAYDDSLDPAIGVPGWTTAANGFLEVWSDVFDSIPASHGTNQLELNAQSLNQTVSQIIPNLHLNCPVQFCFDYTGHFGLAGGTPNNDFIVTLTGGTALSVPLNPVSYYTSGGWTRFCANFVPTSSTVTIAFQGQPHSTAEGPGGGHIDNVSLNQCCAPCPGSPVLVYGQVGGNIVLSWSGTAYHLQTATSLGSGAVWSNVPGSSPVTIQTAVGQFFRLVCP